MIKTSKTPKSFQRHTIASSLNLKASIQSCQPKIKKDKSISIRPKSYESLLKKLTSIQDYQQLKNQLAPYISMNYSKIAVKKQQFKYKKSNWKMFEISNYFGRKLLEDGLFMKHLITCFFNSTEAEYISKTIFIRQIQKKYQSKMVSNKDDFIQYTKLLLSTLNKKTHQEVQSIQQIDKGKQDSILKIQSPKLSVKKQSLNKNINKIKSQVSIKSVPLKRKRPTSNFKEPLQQKQPNLQHEKNQQSQEEEDTYQSCSKIQKWQTQSEKDRRYSGFWDPANRKESLKSARIVKFQEQIKTNKNLQRIQTQIKERRTNEARRSENIESIKKEIQTIEQILKRCQEYPDFVIRITKHTLKNLKEIEKQVLTHYPKVYMICQHKDYEIITEKGIIGKYKGYSIKKLIIKQQNDDLLFAAIKLESDQNKNSNEQIFQEDCEATVFLPLNQL